MPKNARSASKRNPQPGEPRTTRKPASRAKADTLMDDIEKEISALPSKQTHELRAYWRKFYRTEPPDRLSRDLLVRGIAYKIQEQGRGGLSQSTKRKLRTLAERLKTQCQTPFDPGPSLKPGARLVREWHNHTHTVIVREEGFDYDGKCYRSLTQIARKITGAHWSGPRFFGLRSPKSTHEPPELRHE